MATEEHSPELEKEEALELETEMDEAQQMRIMELFEKMMARLDRTDEYRREREEHEKRMAEMMASIEASIAQIEQSRARMAGTAASMVAADHGVPDSTSGVVTTSFVDSTFGHIERVVDTVTTTASPTYSLPGAAADYVPVATSELLELSLTRCSTEVLNEGTGVPVLAVLPTATATTSSTTRANKEAEKQHITNHQFNIAGHDSLQYGIGTWVDAFMSGCGTRISSSQIMLEVMLHGHSFYSPDDGKFSDCLMDVNKTFSILPNIGNAIHGQGNKWPKPPWRLYIEVFKSWFGKMQLTGGYLLEKSPWFLYDDAGKDRVGLEEVSDEEFVKHDRKTLEFALLMLSYAKDQMFAVPGEGQIGLIVIPTREVLPRTMEIQVVFTTADSEFTVAGFRGNIVVFVAEYISPSFSFGWPKGITLTVYGSSYSADSAVAGSGMCLLIGGSANEKADGFGEGGLLLRQMHSYGASLDVHAISYVMKWIVSLGSIMDGVVRLFQNMKACFLSLCAMGSDLLYKVQEEESTSALLLLRKMVWSGVAINIYAAASILLACSQMSMVREALVSTYASVGVIPLCVKVFQERTVSDRSIWSAFIAGISSHNLPRSILLLRRRICQGLPSNEKCYASVFRFVVSTELGKQLQSLVIKDGFVQAVLVASALFTMYSRYNALKNSYKAFEGMQERDKLSWTSMVAGLAAHGHSVEALQVSSFLYEVLLVFHMKNDVASIAAVAIGCLSVECQVQSFIPYLADLFEEDELMSYIRGILKQLLGRYSIDSFMSFNFEWGRKDHRITSIFSYYDMAVMGYPCNYKGCPLFTMERIHHFLRSSESWLSLSQGNFLLIHSEHGEWPALSFAMAALLVYIEIYTDERKALDLQLESSSVNKMDSCVFELQFDDEGIGQTLSSAFSFAGLHGWTFTFIDFVFTVVYVVQGKVDSDLLKLGECWKHLARSDLVASSEIEEFSEHIIDGACDFHLQQYISNLVSYMARIEERDVSGPTQGNLIIKASCKVVAEYNECNRVWDPGGIISCTSLGQAGFHRGEYVSNPRPTWRNRDP